MLAARPASVLYGIAELDDVAAAAAAVVGVVVAAACDGVRLKLIDTYSDHVHSSSPIVDPFLAPYPHP